MARARGGAGMGAAGGPHAPAPTPPPTPKTPQEQLDDALALLGGLAWTTLSQADRDTRKAAAVAALNGTAATTAAPTLTIDDHYKAIAEAILPGRWNDLSRSEKDAFKLATQSWITSGKTPEPEYKLGPMVKKMWGYTLILALVLFVLFFGSYKALSYSWSVMPALERERDAAVKNKDEAAEQKIKAARDEAKSVKDKAEAEVKKAQEEIKRLQRNLDKANDDLNADINRATIAALTSNIAVLHDAATIASATIASRDGSIATLRSTIVVLKEGNTLELDALLSLKDKELAAKDAKIDVINADLQQMLRSDKAGRVGAQVRAEIIAFSMTPNSTRTFQFRQSGSKVDFVSYPTPDGGKGMVLNGQVAARAQLYDVIVEQDGQKFDLLAQQLSDGPMECWVRFKNDPWTHIHRNGPFFLIPGADVEVRWTNPALDSPTGGRTLPASTAKR